MTKVTLNTIAKEAGVSRQTVSRAINNMTGISVSTREKILEITKRYGYMPNRAASELASGNSKLIGVVNFEATEFGPATTMTALEGEARKRGYAVIVGLITDISELGDVIRQMTSQNVSAIVAIAPNISFSKALIQVAPDIPIITTLDNGDEIFKQIKQHYSICTNQKHVAKLAIDTLVDKDHKHILHIPGPLGWFDADQRKKWGIHYAKKYGAHIEVLENNSWHAHDAYEVVKEKYSQLIRERSRDRSHKHLKLRHKHHKHKFPTAIFAANDLLALGAIRALHELGLNVPEDVSVIGVDNYGGTDCFIPPLTTIEQAFEETGKRCMDLIWSLSKGDEVPRSQMFESKLIMRSSVQ